MAGVCVCARARALVCGCVCVFVCVGPFRVQVALLIAPLIFADKDIGSTTADGLRPRPPANEAILWYAAAPNMILYQNIHRINNTQWFVLMV